MDPHSPLTWMTKHFVQSRTPYDALAGLSQDSEDNFALLPAPRHDVKAIEDKTIGHGDGKDTKVRLSNY